MSTEEQRNAVRAVLRALAYPPTIVEVGAYQGDDEDWIREACNYLPAAYLRIEPDERNAAHIRARGRDVILGAVSSIDGYADFHFNADNHLGSGSLRTPSGHIGCFPHVLFPRVDKVKTYTLDRLFDQYALKRIDLLWVDAQGGEREVILGGEHALENTSYIFMEVETREMYAGQALKDELLGMLKARGFLLSQDFGTDVFMHKPS